MHKGWINWVALMGLLALAPARAAGLPPEVRDLRQKYVTYLQSIEATYTNNLQNWRDDQAEALDKLRRTFVTEGRNADANTVRDAALQVAEADEGWDESGTTGLAELDAQLRQFAAHRARLSREKHESILKAQRKYDGLLADRQKKAEGNVELALAIKEERDRAAQEPVVTAAEFELAVMGQGEADGDAPAGDATEEEKASASGGGVPAVAPPSVSDIRVYEAGARPPSEDAASFKKLTLNRTAHSPLACPVVVSAASLDQAETKREGDHHRREDILDRWTLRLQIRSSPAAGTVPGPLVAVQFYIKSAQAQGRVSPELFSVKRVELAQFVPEPTTIDFPAVETRMVRQRMGLGAVWQSSGKEFYGAIISIFDESRNLIYQTATMRGLVSEASPNVPQSSLRERVEEARVHMEAARTVLNESRMFFFANQHEESRRNAFLEATQKFEAAQNAYLKLKQELDMPPPAR